MDIKDKKLYFPYRMITTKILRDDEGLWIETSSLIEHEKNFKFNQEESFFYKTKRDLFRISIVVLPACLPS